MLKLYDPEAEERYIAEAGLLPGNVNVLEKPAASASSEAGDLEAVIRRATSGTQRRSGRLSAGGSRRSGRRPRRKQLTTQ